MADKYLDHGAYSADQIKFLQCRKLMKVTYV